MTTMVPTTCFRVHVKRTAEGGRIPAQPSVGGFRTRMDAVVGLLLSWGGRGGAPTGPEIYKWALGK